MNYQMLMNKILSMLTLSICFFATCFLSGFAQHNENQSQSFNGNNDIPVYKKIIEPHKTNNILQLHDILQRFQNETKKDRTYVSHVYSVLNIINLKYIDDSVIRKDITQLGNSALKADVNSEWGLLDQLSICLHFLRYYEFPYYRVIKGWDGVKISDTISPILRRERVDQMLFIWQKIFSDFDETWTPESDPPSQQEIQTYYGFAGVAIYIEVNKMTDHIKNPLQRAIARQKAELIVTEKIHAPIREKQAILRKYNRQRDLRDIQSRYESYLVSCVD